MVYQNATADAALQQQQFNSVIAQGAKVIVLDPVDSTAAASASCSMAQRPGRQGHRLRPPDPVDQPADYYVSFDNQGIGKPPSPNRWWT